MDVAVYNSVKLIIPRGEGMSTQASIKIQRQFKSMGENSTLWRVKLRSALIMKSTGEDLGSRLLAPWEWVEVKSMNQRAYEL